MLLATGYLGVATVGTIIAMREELPARFLGIRTALSAKQDFVFGMGTALSGPLAFLAAIALAAVGTTSPDQRTQSRANGALAVLGVCGTVGMLGEPITYRTLSRPGRHKARAAIILANVALPASISGLALRVAQ